MTTIKEVSDRLDVFSRGITEKLDASNNSLTDKFESSIKDMREQVNGAKDRLSDSNTALGNEVAHIKGQISMTKLAGIVVTVVFAAMSGAGISSVMSTDAKLKQQREEYEKQEKAYGVLAEKQKLLIKKTSSLLKSEYIDRIERDFSSLGSLDALQKDPDILARINDACKQLAENNQNADPQDGSDYDKFCNALTSYNNGQWQQALDILNKFRPSDTEYFSYAYLRFATLTRLDRKQEAAEAERHMQKLAYGGRSQLSRLAEGYKALSAWKDTKSDQELADAIKIFEKLVHDYPDEYAAYFNLACGYAAKADFDNTKRVLRELMHRKKDIDWVLRFIQQDLDREHFLTEFVHSQFPNVPSRTASQNWTAEMRDALQKL
jgi:hypothetical protein